MLWKPEVLRGNSTVIAGADWTWAACSSILVITSRPLVAVHAYVVFQPMKHWRCEQVSKLVNCLTRHLADRSFSLYAFHMPFINLAAFPLPFHIDDPLHVAAVLSLVILIVLILHSVTERRRPAWQQVTLRALQNLQGLCALRG